MFDLVSFAGAGRKVTDTDRHVQAQRQFLQRNLLRKWLRRLPHPFASADRLAGYRYDVSILQAEFSLTQVLDHPVTGCVFFEQVIR